MGQPLKRSYAWYDNDDSLDEQRPAEPGMAGLPEHWRHYEWKIAAFLFAVLWLVEILTSGTSFAGTMNADPIAKGVWACSLHSRPAQASSTSGLGVTPVSTFISAY